MRGGTAYFNDAMKVMKNRLIKRAAAVALVLCMIVSFSACGGGEADVSGYIINNAAVYTGDGETA